MRKVKVKIFQKKSEIERLFLLFFMLVLLIFFLLLSFVQKEEPPIVEEIKAPEIKAPETPPPLREDKAVIKEGKTLTDILNPYGFSPLEIHNLKEDVKPVYDLSKIKAGHEIRIHSDQKGKVVSLEYDLDEEDFLYIEKNEAGYQAEIKKIPYEIKVHMIWGTIEDNLIFAVTREGEKPYLAFSLAEDVFVWDIDFYTDLRKGDTFKIIFEKKFLAEEFVGYRNILAAEFTNQGKTFQAFRFTYPDTEESDFFNLDGESLRKEFLKSPIKFARITSRFSHSRLHPIRRVYRPHYGVDYAAPVGTPVQATADGTVTFTGWNGASGRMIRIRHKNAYETMYLHLRKYAKGIRKGAKVSGGDVIGYVGSSGESTGPHLDYRIKYKGRYINPLAWRFKRVKPLRQEFFADFRVEAEQYCFLMEAPLVLSSDFSLFP